MTLYYGKALGCTNLAFPLSVLGHDEKYGGQRGHFFASAFGSLIANIIAKLISIANTLRAEREKLYGRVYLFYSKTNQMHQCLRFILFGVTLYMFRTVFPSIIRSSRLYIQQQAYVKQILPAAC